MDKNRIGQGIRKMADSGMEVAKSSESEPSEIWVSPKHWKAMSDENKAMVVDLFHRHNSYSDSFPFTNMLSPITTYDVGITFNIGSGDLKREAIMQLFKELKIAHLAGSWDEIRKAKEKIKPTGN
jgi:hypothetical protein